MGKLLGGIASGIGVILLSLLLMAIAAGRWHLIAINIHPATGYFFVGIPLMVIGTLVMKGAPKFGSMMTVPGVILFIIGLCRAVAPHSSAAIENAKAVQDQRTAHAIQDVAVAAREIKPCDRTMDPIKTPFFDRATGKVRIWVSRDLKTKHWRCFDREGFDPITQQPYTESTIEIAFAIMQQDPENLPSPPPTQVAQATPTPIATPEPTPIEQVEQVAAQTPTPALDDEDEDLDDDLRETPRWDSDHHESRSRRTKHEVRKVRHKSNPIRRLNPFRRRR